jgi:hypothetical protein
MRDTRETWQDADSFWAHGKLSRRSNQKKKKVVMKANPVQEHADRICKFQDPCYTTLIHHHILKDWVYINFAKKKLSLQLWSSCVQTYSSSTKTICHVPKSFEVPMSKKLEPSILYFPSPTKNKKNPGRFFLEKREENTHTHTHTHKCTSQKFHHLYK